MNEGIVTILLTVATYLLMVVAFLRPASRRFHIATMSFIIVYDALMPIYLFLNRDFHKRLIEHHDILTFGVWMHVVGALVLYVLYAFQVIAARRILRDPNDAVARREHRQQGLGILGMRGYVILSGAMLYDPQYIL